MILSLLMTFAPLILKIGFAIIDGVSTNAKAKSDLKQALQQWFDLHKQDANKSADEHENSEDQAEYLKNNPPPPPSA